MNEDRFWFAERSSDPENARYPWTPIMQGNSMSLSTQVWFATQQACEEFIRDEIIGAVGQYEQLKPTE